VPYHGRRCVSFPLVDWALTACESDPVAAVCFFKVNGLIDPADEAMGNLRKPK
jgi:hypothetical protein